MANTLRMLALSASLVTLSSACALHQASDPALPASRQTGDTSPLGPVTPSPAPPAPGAAQLPSEAEWQAFQAQAPRRQPTRHEVAPRPGVMRRYPYTPGTLYAVPTSPTSPTYLVLPPGERLAAPPAVNPEAWVVGLVQMGQEAARQETVVIRPMQPGQRAVTALLFQSGLMIFCQLVAQAQPGLVAVTWDVPQAAPRAPETPVALRPPTIDSGRLHTHYRIDLQSKWTPPWLPVRVFDDGTRTYIQFREALTYTRAPGVFGVTPQGRPALVQSHLYIVPGQPERGAWLIVQGLWTALDLKDSAQLTVRLVRQTPGTPEGVSGR